MAKISWKKDVWLGRRYCIYPIFQQEEEEEKK